MTLHGRRGVGKSALGAKVVDALSAPPGSPYQGIANLSTRDFGTITLERVFFACVDLVAARDRPELEALWAGQRSDREKLARLFAALRGARYLLVLDNLEDQLSPEGHPAPSDLEAVFDIAFRMREAPQFLVTSQVPVLFDPALRPFHRNVHLVEGLPVDDSVQLLLELDPTGEAGVRNADRETLEWAVRRVHGVPRALELVVSTIMKDVLNIPSLLEVLADLPSKSEIVDSLAQKSLDLLTDEERRALDVLAVFGEPVPREAVSFVIEPFFPRDDAQRALARLVQLHMAMVDRASRRFRLLPLDADLAYGQLRDGGPWSRQSLERRVASWYARQRRPAPWRSVTDLTEYRQEFEHRVRAGDFDNAAFVVGEIEEFMVWHGSTRSVVGMHLALLGRTTSAPARLANLVGLGLARHVGGPADEALELMTEARDLAAELGERRQLARALFTLGDLHRSQRQLEAAARELDEAARLARTLGDQYLESHSLMCLSLTYSYMGDGPNALAVAERLHDLAVATGDPMTRARAADAKSLACIVVKRWDDVLSAVGQSLDAYAEAGVPEALGYATNVQGLGHLGLGQVEEAMASFRTARREGEEVETPRVEGLALFNLAWAHWTTGDLEAAADAARLSHQAFLRCGGQDALAAEALASAAAASAAGRDPVPGLLRCADLSTGNTDLVPGEWLTAEAERIRSLSEGATDEP
ncbi:hypothetical protein [Actinomadura sp. K4S16]|uniref:hypothetical protein n=1 Tax=Actinomadura sp. K4S16 TaxID=1316147 RepID=UPI001357463D|nr:hypothetical protein [Actinomadura sp. K4S16]